ncbi:hypothetical protein cyc_00738 [Cyclospora cayetanensis]|uniref:Uncharacterized protein n=1 Tax=Cyclospora cayetanensis TaxID=88456 RepID=A0A1D3D4A0_9EIME|nr:hypothetical protein cyc_00738 [Cyclospora cayetanensis]
MPYYPVSVYTQCSHHEADTQAADAETFGGPLARLTGKTPPCSVELAADAAVAVAGVRFCPVPVLRASVEYLVLQKKHMGCNGELSGGPLKASQGPCLGSCGAKDEEAPARAAASLAALLPSGSAACARLILQARNPITTTMFALKFPDEDPSVGNLEHQLVRRLQQRLRVFVAMVALLRIAPVFLGPALEDPGSS